MSEHVPPEAIKRTLTIIPINQVRIYSGPANIALCRNANGRLIIQSTASEIDANFDIDAVDLLRWFRSLLNEHRKNAYPLRLSPLETTFASIQSALKAGAKWLAVVQALTLPDICTALEAIDGHSTPQEYQEWYSRYLSSSFPRIDPNKFYELRRLVLQQVRTNVELQGDDFDTVNFYICDREGVAPNDLVEGMYNINCNDFCSAIIVATRAWYHKNGSNPVIAENMANFFQIRNAQCPQLAEVVIIE